MKNLIIILVVVFLTPCGGVDSERVETLKIGMSKEETIRYLEDEPYTVEYHSDSESWYYQYWSNNYKTGLCIVFKGDTINYYYSY